MKIVGLDVGEKRIGVAKVDSNTRIAVPVGYVIVDGSEWQEIARILRLQGTNWVVLGLPRSNEGNETKQTLFVRQFAKTLTEKVPGVKVRFQDESLTSVEAEERLKKRQKKYEKGDIDAEAAAIILQDFIEGFKEVSAEDEKQAKKATLKAKKSKKWLGVVIPVVVVGLIAAGVIGVMKIREQRAKERAEYYAMLEANDKKEEFQFTIRPGETIFDIQKRLKELQRSEEIGGYSEAEVAAAFSKSYDFDFLQGRPEGATLEGYLFGETYNFFVDATVEDILTKFLTGTGKVITEKNLVERYAEKGLSLFEGITLASIVQKEASAPEMPTVAQVFLTRLEYGMSLGSDVTVSYALDVVDPGRDSHSDNQAALSVNSCYNTRIYAGLPCGPISNPGLSALTAVAEPTDTDYLFFLTGDDGTMYYSYTQEEHNRNAILHCQELCFVSL